MKKQKKVEEQQTYKTLVLFLRKSKTGKYLYAFNRMQEGVSVLGEGVGSIIMDVSEVERVIAESTEWIKVGVIPEESTGGT